MEQEARYRSQRKMCIMMPVFILSKKSVHDAPAPDRVQSGKGGDYSMEKVEHYREIIRDVLNTARRHGGWNRIRT